MILKNYQFAIYKIKELSTKYQYLSNEEFQNLVLKVKKEIKISKKISNIESIINWFSLVQESSRRLLNLKHFDVQLLAGIYLYNSYIVEMKTGEGKTLVSTLPVSLNALLNNNTHVITINEYLAQRDSKWMGKIYSYLGLTTGLISSKQSFDEKKKNYLKDITYVTNSELVFDYLRDNSAKNVNDLVQRGFSYCLVDEIDSILIDEARTPLILSKPIARKSNIKLLASYEICKTLKPDIDFEIDKKKKDIFLTEAGINSIISKLGLKTSYDSLDPWILEILNALKAKYLYIANKDYISQNGKILIIDEFTGRIMSGRRWSMGLHEAIEIKENITLGFQNQTQSSITYQAFFPMYPKLAGMTGTAYTDKKEFLEIYNLSVIQIPTNKSILRKDLADKIYQDELTKWKAVIQKTKECYLKGQPILIGTTTIEKSEFLSQLFIISNLPHRLLNARPENVKKESEIIAQAGKKNSITIATNMAGRGTDIILGGNINFQAKELLKYQLFYFLTKNHGCKYIKEIDNILKNYSFNIKILKTDIQNLPYSLDIIDDSLKELYLTLYNTLYKEWILENDFIKKIGGLFVLGTERYETQRIDNQLRGRSGRQGDPGESQFFLSLDDELIKLFGGDKIKNFIQVLLDDSNISLDSSFLNQAIEDAQKRFENFNFELRKNVINYEILLNFQRRLMYKCRETILAGKMNTFSNLRLVESFFDLFSLNKLAFSNFKNTNLLNINNYHHFSFLSKKMKFQVSRFLFFLWINFQVRLSEQNFYQKNLSKTILRLFFLNAFDHYWTLHINRLSYIRDTINWNSFGQQNPLDEYNYQSQKSYKIMFEDIHYSMIYSFLKSELYFYIKNR
jgi:preprotein translocase subunit SecA